MALYANERGMIKEVSKANSGFFITERISATTCNIITSPTMLLDTIINEFTGWGTVTPQLGGTAGVTRVMIPIHTIDLGCNPNAVAINLDSDDPDGEPSRVFDDVWSLATTGGETINTYYNSIISAGGWAKVSQGQILGADTGNFISIMSLLSRAYPQDQDPTELHGKYPYQVSFLNNNYMSMTLKLDGNKITIFHCCRLNREFTKAQAQELIYVAANNDKVSSVNILTFD